MNTPTNTAHRHPTPTPADPTATLRAGLPDRYLTPEDIASLFAVTVETVYTWRKRHTGPPAFRVGRHLRYDPHAVHTWTTQQAADDTA